jgi:sulfatase maturation enzyme AslB (radical SAM superfamily)
MEKLKALIKTDKTGYVNGLCSIPWREILIDFKGEIYNCGCEGKVTKSIGNLLDDIHNPEEFWDIYNNSDFKKSILDGSYRYCRATVCSWLQENILTGQADNFVKTPNELLGQPLIIYLAIDDSCNLKCPSCRNDIIIHKNNRRTETIKQILSKLDNMILSNIKTPVIIRLIGSGELFASNSVLPWFLNFNFEKYPNVKFWMHTNATLIHRYEDFLINNSNRIYGFEVSIDAATETTYGQTRLNGDWNDLLKGLRTVQKIADIEENVKVSFSYTVSDKNYRDVNRFANFAFANGAKEVVFYKLQRWNHYSNDQWQASNIFDSTHPLHDVLLKEVSSFDFDQPKVFSNLLYLKQNKI